MGSDQVWRLLTDWGPLLLVVATYLIIWKVFIRRLHRPGGPQQTALAEQKRHNEALEKILEGHEARLQKLESERRS